MRLLLTACVLTFLGSLVACGKSPTQACEDNLQATCAQQVRCGPDAGYVAYASVDDCKAKLQRAFLCDQPATCPDGGPLQQDKQEACTSALGTAACDATKVPDSCRSFCAP